MKKIMLSIVALMAAAASAQAQTGRLFGMESFPTVPMMDFSRYDYSLSTPRAAAMGGAFGSLGADLSSMSINPAGLAMYRRSEFGVTMSVVTNNAIPTSPDGFEARGNNLNTRFLFNSIGMALNTYQGRGDVTSAQFGFGYNRLADLNFDYSYATPTDYSTVGDVLPSLINGVPSASMADDANPYSDPNQSWRWPAVLAYRTRMLDLDPQNPVDGVYGVTSISGLSAVSHAMRYQSRGYVGEYVFSGAVNMQNKLYLGMTVSLLAIDNTRQLSYEEDYIGNDINDLPASSDKVQDFMLYNQWVQYSGAGVGLKLGVIYRPIESLRIGVAFHTPHWVTISRRYRADMTSGFTDNAGPFTWSDAVATSPLDYDYSTPPRLMASASYTIGQVAIVSADYERVWWNGMRSQNTNSWQNPLRDDARAFFKGQDNVRVGAEIRASAAVSVRLGGTYTGSQLRYKDMLSESPLATTSRSLSAGLGWRISASSSLDAAYVFSKTDYTPYVMYDGQPVVTLKNNRNLYMLGFSTRF